jgi:hypothetical protein
LASDTETPRTTASPVTKPEAVAKTTPQASNPEADARTPTKAPAVTKPEADVTTPAKAPAVTKSEADAKTPAKTARRASGTRSRAKTARRAAGTASPAKTAGRAAGTRSPANAARQGTAKTAPRASRPISEPVEVRGALKQWTETGRKVTEDTLELYVKTVEQLGDAEVRAAHATKLPIIAAMAETNAAVSRRIASAYVGAARNLLKA